ncbi:Phytoene synthase [Candidatus Nitrotoga sp. BS]|uniref:presqualene diphosphate synthase HpnD n=1 Tax=Candidatus Nitrotoga sp. BS TaxID=2890408 RepID=UPI001EF3685E|nr:presqualene diphosphate synthase HpnD [Candidatus Nitrotoga sp. BS]CAH1210655.1 Phytoene synthase [Candidatus Nitrotoga sp. BS]
MTPDQYCKDKAAKSGSSFYYSFMFLPSDKRRAITALYAFCREVDDVVDEISDENVARTTLAWWRTEVTAVYAGTPQHPVTRALKPVVKQYNLPQEHFHEIIDGMEMDLQQHQYADFQALQKYCYRVASVVGLLTAEIFGYTDPNTLKYAHDLGLAFQLTNIIRDVGEDARRGRIYMPLNELALFGVHVNDILDNKESEGFQKLMQFQVDRAKRYYKRALDQLPAADRKTQRTGLIMAAIYRATLEEIVTSGCHVLKERVSLTPMHKLWLAGKTWVKN